MDFKKATELFAGPDFDGDPVQIFEPGPEDPVDPPEGEPVQPEGEGTGEGEVIGGPEWPEGSIGEGGREVGEPTAKYHVKGERVKVIAERVQVMGLDGKLITESLKDYTRSCV